MAFGFDLAATFGFGMEAGGRNGSTTGFAAGGGGGEDASAPAIGSTLASCTGIGFGFWSAERA